MFFLDFYLYRTYRALKRGASDVCGKVSRPNTIEVPVPVTSFIDSVPQLAPIAPPSIFDLLFCLTPIVGGRAQWQRALDMNQDNGSDFNGESFVPIHLAPTLEDFITAMDNPSPLESIPFANERLPLQLRRPVAVSTTGGPRGAAP